MKPNEVMIGDWVEPDQCMVPTTYTRVAMIMPDGVYMEEAERQFDFEELHPISVTKEILEANGFENLGNRCSIWLNREDFDNHTEIDYIIDINWFDLKKMTDRLYTHQLKCEVHYVHELQHLLRVAGLNDMADNFKIKKGGVK